MYNRIYKSVSQNSKNKIYPGLSIKHEKNFHIKGKLSRNPVRGNYETYESRKEAVSESAGQGGPANKRVRPLPCSCCSFGCSFWKLRGTLTKAAGQLRQRETECHPSGCLPVWIPFSWGCYRLGYSRSRLRGC